jgi:hypothetical protein
MTRARDVANIDGLLTTTGDTYYASAAGTPARLGIGTTGQVLNVSGGVPAWATPATGAMTLISTATVTTPVATITFNSIPDTYTNLQILYTVYNPSGDWMRMTFNNVNTGTYFSQAMNARTSTVGTDQLLDQVSMRMGIGNLLSNGLVNIPGYKNTAMKKSFTAMTGDSEGTITGNQRMYFTFGRNNATTTISRIDIISPSNLETGSTFSLYGVS